MHTSSKLKPASPGSTPPRRSSIWSPLYQVRRFSARFLRKEAVHNPAFRNQDQYYAKTLWQAIKVRGTIIPSIAPVVLAVFVQSVVVAVLFKVFELPINLDDRMVSMMGSAIAMLLSFRTNRSFERYNQGSQLWTNLATQIRHSSRFIWTNINTTTEDAQEEKKRIMKLLLATAVATKHALRGVDPYLFQDLNQLLPADFTTTGQQTPRLRRPINLLTTVGSAPSLSNSIDNMFKQQESPVGTPTKRHSIPLENFEMPPPLPPKFSMNTAPRTRRASFSPTSPPLPASLRRKCSGNPINAPLDILHHITFYLRAQRKLGTLAAEDAGQTLGAVSAAIDSVTKFEQILYFPVPGPCEAGYAMILATFIMSITFFGTDAIAGEISDPFGNDENDLPLDYFCFKLQDDLEYVMDQGFEGVSLGVGSSDEDVLVSSNGGAVGVGKSKSGSDANSAAKVQQSGISMQLRKRK
ncbi:hypothetical protein BCR33DRAFT_796544 [Rhizoclosmatium globosum]|uniref:Uncharacterized protein n=1 Tax=Rhizoclosmatium globosum TaxID=329046 RepID=A0A1Y2ALF9_9FUNG|nr:hypothetical protein BCR33DRAFT_796544 [Rhizoclosmatium globosum]|eukprot:ORY23334.1 hypothetical protein BCR33DRAFT_796544 [Rhizoclosmatium globosum]